MRYNDRFTNSLKNKELNRFDECGYISDTNRSKKRKELKKFDSFEKEACKYFNRDMWYCISDSARKSLYDLWIFSSAYKTIEHFIKDEKKNIEELVDKSLYRNIKLNKILNNGIPKRI